MILLPLSWFVVKKNKQNKKNSPVDLITRNDISIIKVSGPAALCPPIEGRQNQIILRKNIEISILRKYWGQAKSDYPEKNIVVFKNRIKDKKIESWRNLLIMFIFNTCNLVLLKNIDRQGNPDYPERKIWKYLT